MEYLGIILSKTKYKDRHLICKLLLKSDIKVPVIFYGGQGGGKKIKVDSLDIGQVIRFTANRSSSDIKTNLLTTSQWAAEWMHESIQNFHKAYFQLCLYSELIEKLVLEDEHNDANSNSEVFSLFSNAIFYLDDFCKKNDPDFFNDTLKKQLGIFLAKLTFISGVYPLVNNCIRCDLQFNDSQPSKSFSFDQNGFVCSSCFTSGDGYLDTRAKVRNLYISTKNIFFKNYNQANNFDDSSLKTILLYLLQQFQISKESMKTLNFIFR